MELSSFDSKQFLELMGQGLTITDADGRFLYVNPAYARMLGYAAEALIGKTPFDVTFPEDHATLMLSHVQRLAGDASEYESRLRRADGSELPVLIKGVPRSVNGVVDGAVAVITDLSEHKRAEEALRRNEAYYRMLLENVSDLLVLITADGAIFYDTPALQPLTGYAWDEINALPLDQLLPASDFAAARGRIAALLRRAQGDTTFECRLRAKEGAFRYFEIKAHRLAQPPHFDGVLAVARDISEHKKLEQCLHEAEQRYHTILEYTNDWEMWILPDGYPAFISQACEQMTGYSPGDFQQNPRLVSEILHPMDRPQQEGFLAHLADPHPHDADFRILHRNGETRWISHRCQPVYSSEGIFLGRRASNRDITEQRAAHEFLLRQAEVFRSILDAVIITDTRGAIVDLNPAAETLFGYPRQEVLGAHNTLFYPAELNPNSLQDILPCVQQQKEWRGELSYRARSGRSGVCDVVIVAIFDDSGAPIGTIGVNRDVTERRRLMDGLRASEAKARALFENSPISLWEEDFSQAGEYLLTFSDQAGADWRGFLLAHPEIVAHCASLIRVVDVNRATLKMYAANSKQDLLDNLTRVIPPEAQAALVEQLVGVVTGNILYRWEGVNSRLDGERFDILLHSALLPGEEGRNFRFIVAVEDITLRKRFEAQVLRAKREWEAAFDASSDLVILTGADGRVARCNRAAANRFGGSYAAVLQQPIDALFYPDGPRIGLAMEKMNGERQFPGLAGWFDVTSYLFQLDDAQQGRVFYFRDITVRKEMELTLLASQKMAGLGTLAAGVAHELNSPLQVITGVSESLLKRFPPDDEANAPVRRKLETINRSAWRCADIARSLLTYARPSANRLEAQDLNALLRDTLLLIEHQLESWDNIRVSTNLSENLPLVFCDRNQITEVTINLLTNARDAMTSGGDITISTTHDAARQQIQLVIADTGCGVPAEIQEKIFDPFFTTKPLGQGTGLGLSIVQGILRSHGGEIALQSAPGHGSVFTLNFPAAPPSAADPSSQDRLGRFGEDN